MALYTIGYEAIGMEQLLAALRQAGVAHVVDVRQNAFSFKKGFSRSPLATALSAAGFTYEHLPGLGCPRPIRNQYRADSDWAKYVTAFRRHLPNLGDALAAVSVDCQRRNVALLCYEANPEYCHRSLLAAEIQQRGHGLVRVNHIVTQYQEAAAARYPLAAPA